MPQRQPWSAITSCAEADRRAGGRRRYNALLQFNADLRRIEVERRSSSTATSTAHRPA
jgi:hypothetical protein